MLNRLLTRARLSKKPGAAHGHVPAAYTNCTSPLRKYLDFLVHLQIKAVLRGEEAGSATSRSSTHCTSACSSCAAPARKRSAGWRWNTCSACRCRGAGPLGGRVSHLDHHGFMVRLDANGLEGFVDLRKEKEKFRFDRDTATLNSKTRLPRGHAGTGHPRRGRRRHAAPRPVRARRDQWSLRRSGRRRGRGAGASAESGSAPEGHADA
jgi:exoribonuclease R